MEERKNPWKRTRVLLASGNDQWSLAKSMSTACSKEGFSKASDLTPCSPSHPSTSNAPSLRRGRGFFPEGRRKLSKGRRTLHCKLARLSVTWGHQSCRYDAQAGLSGPMMSDECVEVSESERLLWWYLSFGSKLELEGILANKHLIWFSSFSDEEAHTEEVTCSTMQLMGGKTKASLDFIHSLHHNRLKNEKWHQLFRPPRSRCLPHCLLCPSVEGSNESNFWTPIPDVMSPLPWCINSAKFPYSRTVVSPRIYLPGEQLERNELSRPFLKNKYLLLKMLLNSLCERERQRERSPS